MAFDQQIPEHDLAHLPSTQARWARLPRFARDVVTRFQQHPKQNTAILGIAVLAVIGLGVGLTLLVTPNLPEVDPITLEAALGELDAGHWQTARQMAADLRVVESLPPEDAGGPAYILGVVLAHDAANHAVPREGKALHLLAARYLQEAKQVGFPKGREQHGELELGRNLYKAELFNEASDALLDALASNPQAGTELCRLLSQSYLQQSNPDFEKALEFNGRYLRDPGLSGEARDQGLLTRGRVLLELDQLEDCYKTLQQVGDQSALHAEALLLQGMLLVRQAEDLTPTPSPGTRGAVDAAAKKIEEAKGKLRHAQRVSPYNLDVIRQSKYLLGVCYRRSGDLQAALEEFADTSHTNFDTDEGLAAGLQEAELHRLLGDDEQALAAYRQVLRQAADMRSYRNRWISLDELRERVKQAYHEYLTAKAFQRAIDLAIVAASLLPADQAVQLQAEAHAAWAADLESAAAQLEPKEKRAVQTQARTARRQAGRLYADLARLRFATRQYPGDLWTSAENYLQGHDYVRAADVLRAYLKNVPRRQRPPALTSLGEALLALNRPEEALKPVQECIESYPKDPYSYRARLVAARANLEVGNRTRAKELLLANLEQGSLTPRSMEWQESLFALGQTLYWEGLHYETQSRLKGVNRPEEAAAKAGLEDLQKSHAAFQESIRRLSEVVARDEAAQQDSSAPRTIEARYLLAEAHRRSAKLPQHESLFVTIETTRSAKNRQIQKELDAAAEIYRNLQNLLNEKQSTSPLSELEQHILRNCYFARADALYDLKQYEEAIRAYSTATNLYQHEPESLEAYIQIANCHRQLNRPAEARGTLEQAKVVLNRIRPEANFTRTTRYDREEWQDLLDWLSTM
jgi:TolA-binding protein